MENQLDLQKVIGRGPLRSCALLPAVTLGPSELQRGASALDPRRIAPSFLSQGPELTDFQESLEQLHLLARCYSDFLAVSP
ncbi:protein misato homolog 1-like [Salvelinus alpinus]|uniref:protein misato homolog 1-like n=1 Tax=Salvelinus alpinus TaxID=8036 RepID=UPI0039FCFBC2